MADFSYLTDESGTKLTDESGTLLTDVSPPPTPLPPPPPSPSYLLIPGNIGWMKQSMRTVIPVYDARPVKNFSALTSTYTPFANHLLTDNNGVVLTNKPITYTVRNRLVRWM